MYFAHKKLFQRVCTVHCRKKSFKKHCTRKFISSLYKSYMTRNELYRNIGTYIYIVY